MTLQLHRFRHFHQSGPAVRPDGSRSGVSLMEAMIVLTVIGVLIAISAPSFRRSMEQSNADIASANFLAIWSAQRIYWLDNHTCAATLADLDATDLLDQIIALRSLRYSYSITASDAVSFTAASTRQNSTLWSGPFTIGETGSLTGTVSAAGEADISSGFQ